MDKNVETVNKNVMELHKPSIIENDKKEQYAEEIKEDWIGTIISEWQQNTCQC